MCESFELIDLGDAAVETRDLHTDPFHDNDIEYGLFPLSL